jgi:hypothetical protein
MCEERERGRERERRERFKETVNMRPKINQKMKSLSDNLTQ